MSASSVPGTMLPPPNELLAMCDDQPDDLKYDRVTKKMIFKFYLILINLNLKSHMWPVAIMLDKQYKKFSLAESQQKTDRTLKLG